MRIKYQSWQDYKRWVFEHTINNHSFLFRGQENSEWKLKTSLHRINPSINMNIYIHNIIPEIHNQLLSKGFEIHNLSEIYSFNSFLAKLQHHGFPTPMLDWSYNPYIAAYFAIQNTNPKVTSDYFSIYIFDYLSWIKLYFQPIDLLGQESFISTFKPYYQNNPRLIVQNSIMTITNVNDIESYLSYAENSKNSTYLYKINISKSEIATINNDLNNMGIVKDRLFPDLDQFCLDMKRNFFE